MAKRTDIKKILIIGATGKIGGIVLMNALALEKADISER